MTLKEYIDTIIGDVDEDITDLTLRSRVKKYVNRAYKDLARREGITKTLTLTPIDNLIYKPYDLIKLYAIRCNDNLIPFGLYSRAINVGTDSDVELLYNYLPSNLETEDDETVTNAANDEFIISYGKWLYYLQEGETNNAAIFKEEFNKFKILTQNQINKTINVYGW